MGISRSDNPVGILLSNGETIYNIYCMENLIHKGYAISTVIKSYF